VASDPNASSSPQPPGYGPPGYASPGLQGPPQMPGQQQYGQPPHAASGPSGPRAGFWARFGAYLIDSILLTIVNFALSAALKSVGGILAAIVSIAYFTLLEGGSTGQTLGGRALGLRVIDFDGGGPIGYGRGFLRWIGRILSSIPILLGFFWMLWDQEKQTWHDKISNSVVVPVSAYPVPRT